MWVCLTRPGKYCDCDEPRLGTDSVLQHKQTRRQPSLGPVHQTVYGRGKQAYPVIWKHIHANIASDSPRLQEVNDHRPPYSQPAYT